MNSVLYGGNGYGNLTASPGTPITFCVPPAPDRAGKTRLIDFAYLDATTAHTLTFMRPIWRGTVNAAFAIGTSVTLTADLGRNLPTSDATAIGDYIAIRDKNGITTSYKIATTDGVSAPNALTLSSSLVSATVGGESVWFFGVAGDTDQLGSGLAHPAWTSNSNSTRFSLPYSVDNVGTGFVSTFLVDAPILFFSNNASNAGTLQMIRWAYSTG